jgi:nucleoside-diphosphate-sugar epimerase
MALRIALTGATGFVGKTLIPKLLAAGHQVKALVRNPARANLPKEVEVVQGDLNSKEALETLVAGADVVLHVAGAVSGIRLTDFVDANTKGSIKLHSAAMKFGVKRFVFVSSLAAREPWLSYYGESKYYAEVGLAPYKDKMSLCILRPSAVYGPGDTATLPLLQAIMSNTAMIPGSRKSWFSMIHVEDLTNILLEATTGTMTGTFEIDDGEGGYGWGSLFRITRKHFGTPKRAIYIPRSIAMLIGYGGDVLARLRNKQSMVSSNQMRQLYHPNWACAPFGWQRPNPIPLSEGLPATIRWYQSQGLLPKTTSADTSGKTNQAET